MAKLRGIFCGNLPIFYLGRRVNYTASVEKFLTNRPARMTPNPRTISFLPEHQRAELARLTRAPLTFIVVLIGIVVLWQLIKAVFGLDNFVLPNLIDIVNAFVQPIQDRKPALGILLLHAALFTFREAPPAVPLC